MLIPILVLLILTGLNAFFAASEIAFISLNDNKIEKQAKAEIKLTKPDNTSLFDDKNQWKLKVDKFGKQKEKEQY